MEKRQAADKALREKAEDEEEKKEKESSYF